MPLHPVIATRSAIKPTNKERNRTLVCTNYCSDESVSGLFSAKNRTDRPEGNLGVNTEVRLVSFSFLLTFHFWWEIMDALTFKNNLWLL